MAGIPVSEPGVKIATLKLNAREAYVLSMVDGSTSTEDVAAACGLSDADADAIFSSLQTQGAIRITEMPQKVVVARMSVQKLSLGAALQAESLDDVGGIIGRARAALSVHDLNAARELCNLAWMADPGSVEVARLKAEVEATEKPPPKPAAAAVSPSSPALSIPDPSVSKNPKARSLVMQAVKKAGAGDYAGAFRDVQMASVMEAGNAELTRFKNDLEKLKKT